MPIPLNSTDSWTILTIVSVFCLDQWSIVITLKWDMAIRTLASCLCFWRHTTATICGWWSDLPWTTWQLYNYIDSFSNKLYSESSHLCNEDIQYNTSIFLLMKLITISTWSVQLCISTAKPFSSKIYVPLKAHTIHDICPSFFLNSYTG